MVTENGDVDFVVSRRVWIVTCPPEETVAVVACLDIEPDGAPTADSDVASVGN